MQNNNEKEVRNPLSSPESGDRIKPVIRYGEQSGLLSSAQPEVSALQNYEKRENPIIRYEEPPVPLSSAQPEVSALQNHEKRENPIIRYEEPPVDSSPFKREDPLMAMPGDPTIVFPSEPCTNGLDQGKSRPEYGESNASVKLYMPETDNNDKYLNHVKYFLKAYEIVELIKKNIRIVTVNGVFYKFDFATNRFRAISDLDMKHEINKIANQEMLKLDSSSAYNEVIHSLRVDYTIVINKEQVFPDYRWAFSNTFLNVETGKLDNDIESYFNTSSLKCNYDPMATCPIFDEFLYSVTGKDESLVDLIWQIIGYILSPKTDVKNFFTFLGPKDTGKSLLINLILEFFHEEDVSGLGIGELGDRFALAELVSKRINICSDLTDEVISVRAVGRIKSLTGNDRIRSEAKYKSGEMFQNSAKLVFATNHPLRTQCMDKAFDERQVIVPFRYPVPEEEQDKQLLSRFRGELPGIALKAIAGYKRLQANHFIFPKVVDVTPPDGFVYDNERVISDFINSRCDFTDSSSKVFSNDVFEAYKTFCLMVKVQAIDDIRKFSAIFNRMTGERAQRKKINIGGEALQGYVGMRLR